MNDVLLTQTVAALLAGTTQGNIAKLKRKGKLGPTHGFKPNSDQSMVLRSDLERYLCRVIPDTQVILARDLDKAQRSWKIYCIDEGLAY